MATQIFQEFQPRMNTNFWCTSREKLFPSSVQSVQSVPSVPSVVWEFLHTKAPRHKENSASRQAAKNAEIFEGRGKQSITILHNRNTGAERSVDRKISAKGLEKAAKGLENPKNAVFGRENVNFPSIFWTETLALGKISELHKAIVGLAMIGCLGHGVEV